MVVSRVVEVSKNQTEKAQAIMECVKFIAKIFFNKTKAKVHNLYHWHNI